MTPISIRSIFSFDNDDGNLPMEFRGLGKISRSKLYALVYNLLHCIAWSLACGKDGNQYAELLVCVIWDFYGMDWAVFILLRKLGCFLLLAFSQAEKSRSSKIWLLKGWDSFCIGLVCLVWIWELTTLV